MTNKICVMNNTKRMIILKFRPTIKKDDKNVDIIEEIKKQVKERLTPGANYIDNNKWILFMKSKFTISLLSAGCLSTEEGLIKKQRGRPKKVETEIVEAETVEALDKAS
jgi:ArsR family metal-binding transcriptional regulator